MIQATLLFLIICGCKDPRAIDRENQQKLSGRWEYIGPPGEARDDRLSVTDLELHPPRHVPATGEKAAGFTRVRGSRLRGQTEVPEEHVFDRTQGSWTCDQGVLTLFLYQVYARVPYLHADRESWRILELDSQTLRIIQKPTVVGELRFRRKQ